MSSCSQTSTLFETRRLRARTINQDDAGSIYAVYSDEEAMRWVGDGKPIKYPDCLRWIEVTETNYKKRGYGLSAIELKETGELVGFCGLVHPGGQEEPEIKYAFLKSFWGIGLASETVAGMLAYGRENHKLTSIIATVAAENLPSQNVLKKCGMKQRDSYTEDDESETLVFATRGSR